MQGTHYKLVISGPVGAGKTTAIGVASDIPVLNTDVAATDDVALQKPSTTVAMDFGVMHLGSDIKVHLYGTPGQKRFDFMWEILTIGAKGLVILIDSGAPQPIADLQLYLDAFAGFIQKVEGALVIGLTRGDTGGDAVGGKTLSDVHAELKRYKLEAPVLEIDARQREDVRRLLLALLHSLDPALKQHT